MLSIFIIIYRNKKQNYDLIDFETLKDADFDWVLAEFTTILNYWGVGSTTQRSFYYDNPNYFIWEWYVVTYCDYNFIISIRLEIWTEWVFAWIAQRGYLMPNIYLVMVSHFLPTKKNGLSH